MLTDSTPDPLVEELAEDFVERFRKGERPSISEYTLRHPELARQIQEIFPALVMMEQVQRDIQHEIGPIPSVPAQSLLSNLGDYRIIREIGRGGMGVVYEAEQVSLGRRVALKVLSGAMLGDPKHRKRFEREAKAAARLHHTNIVPVFGVGEQDGVCYYVMQYIHGQGLDDVLKELKQLRQDSLAQKRPVAQRQLIAAQCSNAGTVAPASVAASLLSGQFNQTVLFPESGSEGSASESPIKSSPLTHPNAVLDSTAVGHLSDTAHAQPAVQLPGQSEQTTRSHSRVAYWHSIARIGVQVAQALQHAHEQGIIHRDIKPANLLLDLRGSVWVTDFGLAKASDQQDLTHTGDVLGTLRYMAPEQFDGAADPRSDLYSLGLTLYELLALRPAFDQGERQQLIKQVTTGIPPRLRTLDRDIPRDLETVIHKAIDRDPTHRYQNAEDLADDLSRFLGDEPIKARRISLFAQFRRWCRKNPAIAGLSSMIALLVTSAAVAASLAAVKFEKLADEKGQIAGKLQSALNDSQANLTLAKSEKQRAEEALTLATEQQEKANANLVVGIKALDTVFLDFVASRRTLSLLDTKEAPKEMTTKEKELMQSGLAFYEQLADTNSDNDAAKLAASTAKIRMAMIHISLHNYDDARTNLELAVSVLEPLALKSPNDAACHGELGRSYYNLAMLTEWPKSETDVLCKSESYLTSAITNDPQNYRLYIDRATVRRWLEKEDDGFKDLVRAVELGSTDGNLLAEVAFQLLFSGKFGGAKGDPQIAFTHARRAVQLSPESGYARAVLARCLDWEGKYDEAIREADLAVKFLPNSHFVFITRSVVYRSMNRHEDALRDATQAVHINPSEYSRRHRAKTLAALGRHRDAIAEFDLISEVERGQKYFYWADRADVHLAMKEYESTISHYNRAFQISPRYEPHRYKRRATAYFFVRQYEDAFQDLKLALELNPKDLSTLTWIPLSQVAACPSQEFKDGLLKLATDAIAKNPAARASRLQIAYALGRMDIAREDMKVLTQTETTGHFELYQLALVSLADGRNLSGYQEACRRMLKRFAESQVPDELAFTGWTCALVPGALEDYSSAIAVMQRGVDAHPDHPELRRSLGALQLRAEKYDQALQTLTPLDTGVANEPSAKSSNAYPLFFSAMAHHHTGQKETAKATLTRAVTLAHRELSNHDTLAWNRKLTLELLRDEAVALIGPVDVPPPLGPKVPPVPPAPEALPTNP